MKNYIGTKLIKAKKMTLGDYNKKRGWKIPENENPAEEGYLLEYPDNYTSWSPKMIFESAYLEVEDNKSLPSGVSIGKEMVDNFIANHETVTLGDKTTVVRAILKNGFEITEATGCVDAKNYSEKIGEEICLKKIKDKIWMLLGFLLQTAWKGVDGTYED